ncbi:Molybdenum cofactor synthesis protein 3 [Chytriomyces hyalinus]|nr:Molybdenum cofactor synthesis protein 3 [Chytriomyces hyalinus]KAJ3255415.1 Molybdenum cofactor synthesis protein 3 [Chytriomyces hyalinus]
MSLSKDEIERFSRQILLPELATKGQVNLRKSSCLVVGAGGLGSPAALYLAAAGVGRLGILDYDVVEASNLQRQIIHSQQSVGLSKAESAQESIHRLTSFCECIAHTVVLDSTNAIEIISKYDVIVDATDNVATRYLLNDACVLLDKVLVSGSALRLEGQLTVYHYKGGPCYRCLFPTPPPPETVTNCSDGGVLGAVTGIIGCFQALEAIKLLAGMEPAYAQKLLLLDAFSGAIRVVKLRPKNANCAVCGDNPSITQLIDYVQFCGASATDKSVTQHVLNPSERISAIAYKEILKRGDAHILLDVRDKNQFNIAQLPNAVNIPWSALPRQLGQVLDLVGMPDKSGALETAETAALASSSGVGQKVPVFVLCRLGNDSQLAVKLLKASGVEQVWDIEGGLYAWSDGVDSSFPKY